MVENIVLAHAVLSAEQESLTPIGDTDTLSVMVINMCFNQIIPLLQKVDKSLNIGLLWKKFLDDFLIQKKLYTILIIINLIIVQKI